jgi:hypothetical protein
MKELPLAQAFMLIEPGPVTLVTTAMGRRKNIMTLSWTLVMDFTPKLAFGTGPWNHSFHALMETVLEGVLAWTDPDSRRRRAFHAVGDGTFVADGRRFSHRALMAGKIPPGV